MNLVSKPTRRDLFRYALAFMGGVIGSALGIPVVGYFTAPARAEKHEETWQVLGAVGEFPLGTPQTVQFEHRLKDGWQTKLVKRGVWVVRTGEKDFTVYNPKCTHLGCIVGWHPEHQTFYSPCHGGVFALDGRVLDGPPPRPLDTLEWKVEDGTLYCIYTDFQVGLPYKKEL